MKEKIIIDTDPGIDDALAILLLSLSKDVDVKAITTAAGNKDIQTVTDNARTLVETFDLNVPVFSGSPAPLIRELKVGQVMGETGLGNASRITGTQLDGSAVSQLVELVGQNPGEISVVAIGPLTNVARAMQADPSFTKNLKQLVIMGGAVISNGNTNQVAEFNFFVDPDAAKIVLAAKCRKTLITLDRCYEVSLSEADFGMIKSAKLREFVLAMVQPYIQNLAQFEGQKGAIVYDALAAYYLINPEAFEIEAITMDVETEGELTRGMSVVDRRPWIETKPNVNYVTKIDKAQFKADFFATLNGRDI